MIKPSFIIPGAAKCGTTSLRHYLDLHPDIEMGLEAKSHFFTFVQQGKELNEYKGIIVPPNGKTPRHRGIKCTSYLPNPLALRRIKTVLPQIKFIIILRNPIKRTISHYKWLVKLGEERLPFREAIVHNFDKKVDYNTNEGGNWKTYFTASLYGRQMEYIYRLFSRGDVLVITTEELYGQPLETINLCFNFLGVRPLESVPKINVNVTNQTKAVFPFKVVTNLFREDFWESVKKVPKGLKKEILKYSNNKAKLISTVSSIDREWLLDRLKDDIKLFRKYHPAILKKWDL